MSNPNCKLSQPQIDSLFMEWNKTTILSLERQLELSIDTIKKSFYENRLLAFKTYLKINNSETINPNSIRYKFLTELSSSQKGSEFYIIEANESGAKVLLRTFVLFTNPKTTKVDIYINDEKWKRTGFFELKDFSLKEDLSSYITLKGFNNDDIIITRFENTKVKKSEYFLSGTLALSSGIKNILDNFKKENFFSN